MDSRSICQDWCAALRVSAHGTSENLQEKSNMRFALVFIALGLAGSLASCVDTVPAKTYDHDAEKWVEVDSSGVKASADDFRRWYKAELGKDIK
jgi:hypothetical protein